MKKTDEENIVALISKALSIENNLISVNSSIDNVIKITRELN